MELCLPKKKSYGALNHQIQPEGLENNDIHFIQGEQDNVVFLVKFNFHKPK